MNWRKICSFLYDKKNYILVQLEQDSLLLAHATKRNNKFHIHNSITHNINRIDFSDRLYNLTKLHNLQQKFITDLHLKKTSLIICAPFLQNQNQFYLLQILLCFSKNGFAIEHVSPASFAVKSCINHTSTDTCPEKRNILCHSSQSNIFLPRGYHATNKIFLTIAATSACLAIAITSTHTTLLKQKNGYQAQLNKQIFQLKQIQKKAKETHELEKENINKQKQFAHLTKQLKTEHNPSNMLLVLSKLMPPQNNLIKLRIGNKKTQQPINTPQQRNKAKETTLQMQGVTHNPEEIGSLVQTLSQALPNARLSITHIKKEPQKNGIKTPYYSFAINGTLIHKKA